MESTSTFDPDEILLMSRDRDSANVMPTTKLDPLLDATKGPTGLLLIS